MKFLGLLFLLLTCLSFASEGGDRVGNGGDILICQVPGGEAIYVLDEYEEKDVLSIGPKNLDYTDKVEILLNKVKVKFPARYQLYVSIFNNFRSNVTFVNSGLPDINDTGASDHPYCDMSQAAYFYRDHNDKFRYFVDKEVWDLLSNDQRAVLVMHEIIYTEAVGLGHDSSKDVRLANRLLFSNKKPFSGEAFDQLIIEQLKRSTRTASALENAYSPAIAIYLLSENLAPYYSNKALKGMLMTLKNRFSDNAKVVGLVNLHLRRIGRQN